MPSTAPTPERKRRSAEHAPSDERVALDEDSIEGYDEAMIRDPETSVDPSRLPLAIGCLSGFCVATGLVLCFFALRFSNLRVTLAQYGRELPTLTRIVTDPFYYVLAPGLVLGAVIGVNVWVESRTKRLGLLGAVAVLGTLGVILGYWGAVLPFSQLSAVIE
ncbi:MAG: hypothetical protein KC609_02090 [Myxococcales bacterium]|nr:hypothetical protein [Myxococcales bacterium]